MDTMEEEQSNREHGVRALLATLSKKGQVTLGVSNSADVYPKLPSILKQGRATELLDEERGSR